MGSVFQSTTCHCVAVRYTRRMAARDMMTRSGQGVCLKQIAGLCGFCDQTHLSRHFRRIFGITPAEYLRARQRSHHQSVADGRNVLNFVRNVRSDAVAIAIDVA
jgi:transcriptional regulator GlxA family with amidase domain